MTTVNLPTLDLSRPRLRQISHWIRDELDPLVAREGPELLRADDVLSLHDVFQALKTSSSVTALDLRATGIHKAVMEISGMATRWPGRLADDCDQLISLWSARFGRLEELHPFLYGRGGRLEGIASIDETNRLALLRRWYDTCPDRISPKRALRRGSLGFYPGSWWINTLFACHAGIIDVESIDGGICHDKYGAYAIVITEATELDAPTESTLTYRCDKNDRGKFRLTAATPRSREPVRVLRSHSVNSIWGPKAGVRYEGLYRVIGWAVHQPGTASSRAGQKLYVGDMFYDVHLERCDPVAMDEVAKSPTASELDDYAEYKRLRRVHRDIRNKATTGSCHRNKVLSVPTKVAPSILPPVPPRSRKVSLSRASPAPFRAITSTVTPNSESPGNVDLSEVLTAIAKDKIASATTKSPPNLPTQFTALPSTETETLRSGPPRTPKPSDSRGAGSIADISESLTEVAPWIDYDPSYLAIPTTTDFTLTARSTASTHVPSEQQQYDVTSWDKGRARKNNGEGRAVLRPSSLKHELSPMKDLIKNESKALGSFRNRKPAAKLFDGSEDMSGPSLRYFSLQRPRTDSESPGCNSHSTGRPVRNDSTADVPETVTPVYAGCVSPSRRLFSRRDAIALPHNCVTSSPSPIGQNFECLEGGHSSGAVTRGFSAEPVRPLPITLRGFVATAAAATGESTPAICAVTTYSNGPGHTSPSHTSTMGALAASTLEQGMEGVEELEDQAAFRNPFNSPVNTQTRMNTKGSDPPQKPLPDISGSCVQSIPAYSFVKTGGDDEDSD